MSDCKCKLKVELMVLDIRDVCTRMESMTHLAGELIATLQVNLERGHLICDRLESRERLDSLIKIWKQRFDESEMEFIK